MPGSATLPRADAGEGEEARARVRAWLEEHAEGSLDELLAHIRRYLDAGEMVVVQNGIGPPGSPARRRGLTRRFA